MEEKKSKFSKKFKLACAGLILLVLLMCLATIGILWYGGFIKDFTCKRVIQGSGIWNSLSCESSQQAVDQKSNDTGTVTNSSEEQVITTVIKNASPSVVSIGTKGDNFTEDQIIGTGFVVENNIIVTNRHVVENETATYFIATKDSKVQIKVNKIDRDPINDLAFVHIEDASLKPLTLGDSDDIKIGQTAIAIGSPLGKYTGTVTKGIISGLHREVQISNDAFGNSSTNYSDVIQTDAAINPGNSGGPLLNTKGEVIGVNFATVKGAENLSFALPINRIKSRLAELDQFGKFKVPFVGVVYRTRLVFLDNKSLYGAVVQSVVADSPATKAGIVEGDIIVEFNGSDLSEKSLIDLIQTTKIGDEVSIVVIRDKKLVTLKVVIGEK